MNSLMKWGSLRHSVARGCAAATWPALALALLVAAWPAGAATPISAIVEWDPPVGDVRHLVLVGSVNGAAFEGTVDDAQSPMSVSGYVSADGHLSGTVRDGAGAISGTFTSSVPIQNADGTKTYSGTYTLSGNHDGGTWTTTR